MSAGGSTGTGKCAIAKSGVMANVRDRTANHGGCGFADDVQMPSDVEIPASWGAIGLSGFRRSDDSAPADCLYGTAFDVWLSPNAERLPDLGRRFV